MMNENINVTTKNEQPDLIRKIGKTTYKVKVYFNPTGRETMNDKIKRMLRSEVGQM